MGFVDKGYSSAIILGTKGVKVAREETELSKLWLLVSLGNMLLLGPNILLGSLNILSCAYFQRLIEPKNNNNST